MGKAAEPNAADPASQGTDLDRFLATGRGREERFHLREELARRDAEEESSRRRIRETLERRAREGLALA